MAERSGISFIPRPAPFRCSGPHSPSSWDPVKLGGGCRSARLRKAAVETGSPEDQGSPAVNLLYPVYRRWSFLACAGLSTYCQPVASPNIIRGRHMTERSGYSRNLLTISTLGARVNFLQQEDWEAVRRSITGQRRLGFFAI